MVNKILFILSIAALELGREKLVRECEFLKIVWDFESFGLKISFLVSMVAHRNANAAIVEVKMGGGSQSNCVNWK